MCASSTAASRLLLFAALAATATSCMTSQAGEHGTPASVTPASPTHSAPPDRGSPAEIRSTSSVGDGADVVVPCDQPGSVGVVGRGQVGAPAITGDGATFNRWVDEVARRTQMALGDHVVAVGWGVGCVGGDVGPRVYVDHYAALDEVVERLVAFVRREDLDLHFLVLVQDDPVPL